MAKSTKKKSPAKPASARSVKKASTPKSSKKTTKKKAAKKSVVKKTTAKKTSKKKAPAKKKAAATKVSKKKAVAKKATTKKTTKKKTTKKSAPKKKVAKAPAKKTAAKKSTTKKSTTKKTTTKKAVTKKSTAKKAPAKKAAASSASVPAAKPKSSFVPPKVPYAALAMAPRPAYDPDAHTPLSDAQLRKVKTGLTAKDLRHFRQELLERRAEIIGDVQGLEAARAGNAGEISHMPLHMADVGSDSYEQEFTLGLMESERKTILEIDAALQRIVDKTYGVCVESGVPIGRPRLEAKPWAKYCIEVARERERRGR